MPLILEMYHSWIELPIYYRKTLFCSLWYWFNIFPTIFSHVKWTTARQDGAVIPAISLQFSVFLPLHISLDKTVVQWLSFNSWTTTFHRERERLLTVCCSTIFVIIGDVVWSGSRAVTHDENWNISETGRWMVIIDWLFWAAANFGMFLRF